ncbi:MAG: DUF4401 domain-containing protein [Phototrophicaceae bacterium]
MTTPTLQTVLDQLHAEHLLGETERADAQALFQQPDRSPSWMIQGVMGCGAWIAALFLLLSFGFLFTGLLNSDHPIATLITLLIGVGLIGVTARMRRTSTALALIQFLLVYQVVGQGWLLVGVVKALMLFDPVPYRLALGIFSSVMIAMQLVMIPLYADRLYRFLAGLAIVGGLFALLVALALPYTISLGVSVLACATALIWSGSFSAETVIALRPIVRPVSYALAVGMLGALIFETILGDLSLYAMGLGNLQTALVYPIISAVALTLITLWQVTRWLNEHQHRLFSRLGVAIIALLLVLSVPSAFTPGIMAGVLLLLLGFRNRNAVLSGLAYAFLCGFVIYFYYDLQTTLLVKSLILMLSGLLLLVSRLLIPTFISEETA